MGLLGDSFDDPRTMATFNLAAGLLSGGNIGQSAMRGLAGYQDTMNTQRQLGMREALTRAQLMEMQQQMLMQQLQYQRLKSLEPLFNMLMGGAQQGAPQAAQPGNSGAALAGAQTLGPSDSDAAPFSAPPPASQPAKQGGFLANATPDQIGALKLGGFDLSKEWEDAKFGRPAAAGSFRQNADGSITYLADPAKGVGYENGTAFLIPGAASTQAALTAATEGAKARIASQNELVTGKVNGADTIMGTKAQILSRLSPLTPATADANITAGGNATYNLGGQTGTISNGVATQGPISAYPAASPAAASGGGIKIGMSPAEQAAAAKQMKFAEGQGTSANAYGDQLNGRVQSGQDLMMRLSEAQNALSQFQPGMGAEVRLNIARAAQALGAPQSLIDSINQGSVAAKQEFMKLAAQQAMEALKQSMGGSGRITQAEFKVFQQNNPNIELDPQAISKIYDFTRRVYQRDATEQQYRSAFLQGGGDPSEWPVVWSKQLDAGTTGKMSIPGVDAKPAKPQYSDADLQYTALKNGISVQEVKRRLGVQ